MIQLYNTLTRKKEVFEPIEKGKVKMYVCGPTVYNYIHLGNARPIIVFDTIRRYLEYRGYDVTYVQNFTDVDDKIINKSKETGKSAKEISEQFIEEYFRNANDLGVRKADIHPKVTENMEDIVNFIKGLVENNTAYPVNGDVYFETEKFKDYGKLSKQSIEDLNAGARIEVDEKKKNPLDFALWKAAKADEVFWESPWGEGRPGWHIECSAMVNKYLGKTIDIHAGGADLIFPHHENEIAQSESLNHSEFAKYWMHNGYININNEKMSKSLGNVFTVNELLNEYDPMILRYLILSVHYRHPINFSKDLFDQSIASLERIKTTYANIMYRMESAKKDGRNDLEGILEELKKKFEKEMDDDFNTANAITVIFDFIKQANIYLQGNKTNQTTLNAITHILQNWLGILGLDKILESNSTGNNEDQWVEDLIEERKEAKRDKNWARADEIRDFLSEKGIILEDTPQGVRWRRK